MEQGTRLELATLCLGHRRTGALGGRPPLRAVPLDRRVGGRRPRRGPGGAARSKGPLPGRWRGGCPALRARLLIARAGYTDDPAAAAAADEAAALASDHQLAEVEGLLLRREAFVYSDPSGGMRTSGDRMLRAHDALVTAGFEFETAACARFDTVERLPCPALGFRIELRPREPERRRRRDLIETSSAGGSVDCQAADPGPERTGLFVEQRHDRVGVLGRPFSAGDIEGEDATIHGSAEHRSDHVLRIE